MPNGGEHYKRPPLGVKFIRYKKDLTSAVTLAFIQVR